MKTIVIFGAGQHARVVADAIEKRREFEVAAFIDDAKAQSTHFGYPIWSKDQLLRSEIRAGVIAVGDNYIRSLIAEEWSRSGFEFVSVVHPSAQIARDVEILPGAFLAAGVVVNPGARLGRHVLINTSASIDHDCNVDEFVSVGPGATINGNVKIGMRTAIASGAVVSHGLTIGPDSVVGLGAVVVSDVESKVVAYGNPCAKVRTREIGERYL